MENKPNRYTESRNFRARLVLASQESARFLKAPASAVGLKICATRWQISAFYALLHFPLRFTRECRGFRESRHRKNRWTRLSPRLGLVRVACAKRRRKREEERRRLGEKEETCLLSVTVYIIKRDASSGEHRRRKKEKESEASIAGATKRSMHRDDHVNVFYLSLPLSRFLYS